MKHLSGAPGAEKPTRERKRLGGAARKRLSRMLKSGVPYDKALNSILMEKAYKQQIEESQSTDKQDPGEQIPSKKPLEKDEPPSPQEAFRKLLSLNKSAPEQMLQLAERAFKRFLEADPSPSSSHATSETAIRSEDSSLDERVERAFKRPSEVDQSTSFGQETLRSKRLFVPDSLPQRTNPLEVRQSTSFGQNSSRYKPLHLERSFKHSSKVDQSTFFVHDSSSSSDEDQIAEVEVDQPTSSRQLPPWNRGVPKTGNRPSPKPEGIKIAITHANYPETDLSQEQLAALQRAIMKSVEKIPENGLKVRFLSCTFEPGWLSLVCADVLSMVWLENEITHLKPWHGAKLRFLKGDEVPQPHVFVAYIPDDVGFRLTTEEVLLRLRKMNQGLNTKEWRVLSRVESGPGQTWTFSVDDAGRSALARLDYCPFVGFGQVQFRYKGRKGSKPSFEERECESTSQVRGGATQPFRAQHSSATERGKSLLRIPFKKSFVRTPPNLPFDPSSFSP